jgi:DnaJ-class molecular chaperone
MDKPTETTCPDCTGRMPGFDDKTCGTCHRSGKVPVDELSPGSDPYVD